VWALCALLAKVDAVPLHSLETDELVGLRLGVTDVSDSARACSQRLATFSASASAASVMELKGRVQDTQVGAPLRRPARSHHSCLPPSQLPPPPHPPTPTHHHHPPLPNPCRPQP
jgi:hypothetical protein